METNNLRLAMELITARANEEGNNGVGILTQLGGSFIETFEGLIGSLSTFFNAAPPVAFLPNTYKDVDKTLRNVSYVAINNIGMPVPEGFKGDIVGYSEYLQKSISVCAQTNHLIDELYKIVSVCLTNPNMPQETHFPVLQKEFDREGLEKLGKNSVAFIDPNSSNGTIPYGKVIKRNSDWPLVVKETDKLRTALAGLDKKGMLENAKKLDVSIGKLIQQRKNKPEFVIDTQWLKFVTQRTYLIALYLEFTAVTYYRCMAYFQSVDGISQKLIVATKD